MDTRAEVCANCGQKIGRLEQAFLYHNEVTCAACYERLQEADAVRARRVAHYRSSKSVQQTTPIQEPQPPQAVTVELTSKKWKRHQMWAAVIAVVSMLLFGAGVIMAANAKMRSDDGLEKAGMALSAVGAFGVICGLIYFTIARAFAWWHHG